MVSVSVCGGETSLRWSAMRPAVRRVCGRRAAADALPPPLLLPFDVLTPVPAPCDLWGGDAGRIGMDDGNTHSTRNDAIRVIMYKLKARCVCR